MTIEMDDLRFHASQLLFDFIHSENLVMMEIDDAERYDCSGWIILNISLRVFNLQIIYLNSTDLFFESR